MNKNSNKQPAESSVNWHTLSIEEACSKLNSSASGLSGDEARRRLSQYGPNELKPAKPISAWAIFFAQFKNILIIILLIATVISAFLGHQIEAWAIAVIVLFAVTLAFIQEYRAEFAIEALRKMTSPSAKVLRDGKDIEIPATELVPGDAVLLKAGDKIPADIRLIEAVNIQVDESALTGESVPIEKHNAAIGDADLAIGDRKNMGYAGTILTYGRGSAIVVETGTNTEFGKIAEMLQTVESGKTPLQENLDKLGCSLAKASLVIVAVIVALGLFRGQPFIEIFIFGIALAVAVVPEALPAVVTISLAIGVQRLIKRNALMRRLSAVETLGSTSVICSDKTGTLTKDEMTVRNILIAGKKYEVSGAGYIPEGQYSENKAVLSTLPEPLKLTLQAGVLSSDAHIANADGQWSIKGDPTEGALVVAAAKAGINRDDINSRFPRQNEIPFSSESKRMTTLHKGETGNVAYSKGAPEIILNLCIKQLTSDGEIKEDTLNDEGKETLLRAANDMAGEGMRVLALAYKPGAEIESADKEMVFLGLAGMIDPPRPEARESIKTCEQAGIKVVMITGDHPLTAQAVARELGLHKTGKIVSGEELDSMSDTDLEREVKTIEVYARVSPAHKLRVVTALQKNNQVVAMTGDGVNDAPALKKADIGIAMGITGTDVTKESAAMTITDDNFASIVAAVEEGRIIFGNIRKYLMYLISSNIGEIGLLGTASLAGLPLPLTAVQILYVNLATDGLPALALAIDPHEKDIMKLPPRDPHNGIFTKKVIILMLTGGVWSTIMTLSLFIWARKYHGLEEAMTMTFVLLVFIEFFKAYAFRSERTTVLDKPFANKWLNLAILFGLVLLGIIVYVPFLQKPFGTFNLSPHDLTLIILLASTVLPVIEIVKWLVTKFTAPQKKYIPEYKSS